MQERHSVILEDNFYNVKEKSFHNFYNVEEKSFHNHL